VPDRIIGSNGEGSVPDSVDGDRMGRETNE
jgi:hypothetical protein